MGEPDQARQPIAPQMSLKDLGYTSVSSLPRRGRATRRQKSDAWDIDALQDNYAEAGTDHRDGWRATKAKGTRRNRRYEKRLLRNVGNTWNGGSGNEDDFCDDENNGDENWRGGQ